MVAVRDRARDEAIAAAFLGGENMAAIGRHYGISRERVRQLLIRQNVPMTNRFHRLGFHPLNPADPRFRYGWSRAGVHWWRTHHKHKATRRDHLAKVRAYVAATGDTTPSNAMILALVGVASVPRFTQIWGMPQHHGKRYVTYLNRFRRLAGITARPQGYWGRNATT